MFEEVGNVNRRLDVKGGVLRLMSPTLMMKAANVVVMMMKVVTSYRKKADTNVRDESSYATKFSSSTTHKLLQLVYV